MTATKTARINLRIRQADDELLRHAAKVLGESLNDFVAESAVERAYEVLADQRHFELDAETWDAFVEALDRPVKPDPRLVELFSRPSRIR